MSTPPIQGASSPIFNTAMDEEIEKEDNLKSYSLYYQQAVDEKQKAQDQVIQAHVKELENFFKGEEPKVDK